MPKVELGGNATYVNPKNMSEGDVYEGIYKGYDEKEFKGKPAYSFKLEQEDGSIVSINGRGQLNAKMSKVPEDAFVQIVYRGKIEMSGGEWAGTLCHAFDVEWWDVKWNDDGTYTVIPDTTNTFANKNELKGNPVTGSGAQQAAAARAKKEQQNHAAANAYVKKKS